MRKKPLQQIEFDYGKLENLQDLQPLRLLMKFYRENVDKFKEILNIKLKVGKNHLCNFGLLQPISLFCSRVS